MDKFQKAMMTISRNGVALCAAGLAAFYVYNRVSGLTNPQG